MSRFSRPGRLLEAPGNRRPRGMAVTRAGRYQHAIQNPAYRLADVTFKGARRIPVGRPPSFWYIF